MKLLWDMMKKDVKRNKAVNMSLAIFLLLASLLLCGGLRVAGVVSGSVKSLNETAVIPEYIQMHTGEFDGKSVEKFVQSHEYIKDYLILQQLNIDNENLFYNGVSMGTCLMDNGFVTQNSRFDYLLNENNQIADIKTGEIGVPVYYAQELGMKEGDVFTIRKDNFRIDLVVSTIIKDSTMNGALTSSKRFLVSELDQKSISEHVGSWEYCFEFLFQEGADNSSMEKDYKEAGLPSNGVAITGQVISMLNALSYEIIAFVLIAVSLLMIAIACLCLSYIIKASMLEENRTIGELRAIGFNPNYIIRLYELKYIVMTILAVMIGYLGAVPFGRMFTDTIIAYCGEGKSSLYEWVLPLAGCTVFTVFVILRCRRILKKHLKHSIVGLLRGEDSIKREGHFSLNHKKFHRKNLMIALGELKCKWKEYIVLFIVFIFASFLIVLPRGMKKTIDNPSFVTYMGIGACDIRVDIQYCENVAAKLKQAEKIIQKDKEIVKYAVYKTGYARYEREDGSYAYIRVSNGDEKTFPLNYLKGCAPSADNEIALSYMNAQEMGKSIGDSVIVQYKEDKTYRVSGIYQDITYGGKTAKARIDFTPEDTEVYIIYLDTVEGVNIEKKAEALKAELSDCRVTPIQEFILQTLGGISQNMNLISTAVMILSFVLIILITVMLLQLLTAREHSMIAVKKAVGFTSHDIQIQYGIRIFIVQAAAIMVGTILAETIGESIFSLMLSTIGATKIEILNSKIETFLVFPAIELMLVVITVVLGTSVIKKYDIRDQIME